MLKRVQGLIYFFCTVFFWRTSGSFSQFSPLLPLIEVSPQPSAIPGGNPPGDWQSAVDWGDDGFEPGTAFLSDAQNSSAKLTVHSATPPPLHGHFLMKVLGHIEDIRKGNVVFPALFRKRANFSVFLKDYN